MNAPANWRLRGPRLRLEGESCPHCEAKIFPPRDVCPNCGDITIQKASADGLLGVVLHSAVFDEENPKCPVTVMVELASGDKVFGYLIDPKKRECRPEIPNIGTKVILKDPAGKGLKTVENDFNLLGPTKDEPAELVGKVVEFI